MKVKIYAFPRLKLLINRKIINLPVFPFLIGLENENRHAHSKLKTFGDFMKLMENYIKERRDTF